MNRILSGSFTVLFLLSVTSVLIKNPVNATGTIYINQTYGGSESDVALSVVQTVDGGYAITGPTESFGVYYTHVWLVKTDELGNHVWNKTYGEVGNEGGSWSVIQTDEGGYAITGYTGLVHSEDSDAWLIKTDELGNHEWNKTYGGTNSDSGHSLVQTVDGGYAIAGSTWSFGAGVSDFWLVKTDQYGVIPEFPLWTPFLLVLITFTFTIAFYRRRLH